MAKKGNVIKNPLVSVITVSYNCAPMIEKSILSVLYQTYKNIEFVIKDGCSTDGTQQIVKRYLKKNNSLVPYAKKGVDVLASEKDKGIYDAMNAAVMLCHGDIVYFLNADDAIHGKDVVEKAVEEFSKGDSDLVFGDVLFVYPKDNAKVRVSRNFSLGELKKGTMPPHQGTFVKRDWLVKEPFDTSLRSSADFDWFCRVAKKGIRAKKMDLLVADFTSGGVSSGRVSYSETESIVRKHFGLYSYFLLALKHRFFSSTKFFLRKTGLLGLWRKVNSKARII